MFTHGRNGLWGTDYLQERFVLLDKKFTIRVINYSFIDPSEIIMVHVSKETIRKKNHVQS